MRFIIGYKLKISAFMTYPAHQLTKLSWKFCFSSRYDLPKNLPIWPNPKHTCKSKTRDLTSSFSKSEGRDCLSLMPWPENEAGEKMPTPRKSTNSERNHGVHDRVPYFLISNTYINGLVMNRVSPKRNNTPRKPLWDKTDERVGFSTTRAATEVCSLVEISQQYSIGKFYKM